MTPLITELPYREDSAEVFAAIAHRPWAMLLDSGWPGSSYGRYDIMVADPVITLTTRGDLTEVTSPTGHEISRGDPFGLVRDYLGRQQERHDSLPFMGGAVGYFAYDLARRLERLPATARDAEHLPEMQVGIYDWALVVDHQEQRTWLASYGRAPLTRERWGDLAEQFRHPAKLSGNTFSVLSPVASNMDEAQYAAAFRRILHYIHEGDCYQVNLAQRFSAQATGDAWTAYRHLRRQSPAPFAAYLNLPEVKILSASPERFLQVRHGQVETRPIKGTRPRSTDSAQDKANADELLASIKDRAENLMIVDLLRNDIGKNCMPGSVRADRMFELESFPNVHHLVSTVTGRLAPGHTAMHLLRGCFPGGSITGAPKLRAMQIIEELEPHRRGVYCGAIGYIGFDGNMDTNIAIRTAVFSDDTVRFWAGGGIVADSEEQKEYRETWDKAANMLALMEAFRVGR
ncbi:MAG TPA: aminodeoxychorismate synthase component I [Novimethylophilus sp.]|uniref:aminodeoxychorismate synthase component I n=1 Tax=Novimethylophilus sp. TaxID=2137426 RepID=UPI002F429B9E